MNCEARRVALAGIMLQLRQHLCSAEFVSGCHLVQCINWIHPFRNKTNHLVDPGRSHDMPGQISLRRHLPARFASHDPERLIM
jgi:hypothetical protein